MNISPLIAAKAELTDGGHPSEPIVLSTRIRLARNIAPHAFPGWANKSQRADLRQRIFEVLASQNRLDQGICLKVEDLNPLEKQVLVERHLISRELSESEQGSGVAVSKDQVFSIMVNEEDHLRIQAVASGFNFNTTWASIDALDTSLEDELDFAYSSEIGYLTACPTNLGTGIRASAMLHLPGLVFEEHMEKVVRMVNQLGMAVRGLYGEGSEGTGSIFQISNQQTLGETEGEIIKRLISILHAIIEQEENARMKILEEKSVRLFDKIGRAVGILQNGHLLSSDEGMNLLSLLRLAVDLKMLPENYRTHVDRLFIETQPGHIQYMAKGEVEPGERDRRRAERLREELADLPSLQFPA